MRITRSLSAIIITLFMAALPLAAPAQLASASALASASPPPPLPVYSQPVAPYPNYQWTPGYWGWGPAGYYWVPGTWVAPPSVGVYWTPGYWGAGYNGAYGWNTGYWGPSVGFYGGINYGFGYFGAGFVGGYWAGNAFSYNTAVMNVNRNVVRNVYVNKTVINKERTLRQQLSRELQRRSAAEYPQDRRRDKSQRGSTPSRRRPHSAIKRASRPRIATSTRTSTTASRRLRLRRNRTAIRSSFHITRR